MNIPQPKGNCRHGQVAFPAAECGSIPGSLPYEDSCGIFARSERLSATPSGAIPRVVLKGAGRSAEELIWANQKGRGKPLVNDPKLLDRLYRLPVDGPIPFELFELVAAVLVHVLAVDSAARESMVNRMITDEKDGGRR